MDWHCGAVAYRSDLIKYLLQGVIFAIRGYTPLKLPHNLGMNAVSTSGIRSSRPEVQSSAPPLPRELTPLIAEGAIIEPLFVNHDWMNALVHGPCAGITLPEKADARASLWMPQEIMDGAREYMSYECHDLRIIKVAPDGELSLLVCKRVEPTPSANGSETAPINGFWWSIGGRREIPKSGSPLDEKFQLIDSVLQKANREAGVKPENVQAVYDLGIGRTEFPATMRYVSRGTDADGNAIESSREVLMANPQRTINRNFVLFVDSDSTIADQSVEHLTFMSERDYADPRTRAQFCAYEQKFIDAIFQGWKANPVADLSFDSMPTRSKID